MIGPGRQTIHEFYTAGLRGFNAWIGGTESVLGAPGGQGLRAGHDAALMGEEARRRVGE